MTTREDNLKKINEEPEKLDDEQLESVAGGTLIPLPPGFNPRVYPPIMQLDRSSLVMTANPNDQ